MPKDANRPNILWVSFEDTSPRFACYGDPVARTPNVDRLAASACRFDNAFSVAGVCAPSRSAIITGMYPTFIGAHHMRTAHTNPATPELPTPYEVVPPPYVKAFTEYLRAAGYYCTNDKKTDYQFAPPSTAWDECGPGAHWRHRPEGAPFFAVFNLDWTHESGMWEKEGSEPETDPGRVSLPPYLPDTPKARRALARHYDNLAKADRRLGEILDELEADGLSENTIVFIWSDHGEGLPRGKRWPYDSGIRIPLIVRWPGVIELGSVSDELVSLIDLGPTVLSLAGCEVPRHMQGRAFLGPKAEPREYVYATRDRHDVSYDMVRAVRDKRFKYIRNYCPQVPYLDWIPYRNRHPVMHEIWRLHLAGELNEAQQTLFRWPKPVEELYDCEEDPYELNNLAESPAHRAVISRLRSALDSWRERYDVWGDVPEEQMVRQMWPGGVQPQTAPVVFIPIGDGANGVMPGEGTFRGPMLVQLHCATQGASIAYRVEGEYGDRPAIQAAGDVDGGSGRATGEADDRWMLYTVPLRLDRGKYRIIARAERIGYKPSEVREAKFEVN